MDTSKIIKGVVNSGRYTVTAPIVKEDYGLYLQIEGVELPSTYEVDFSNSENSGTSVTMIGNADGVLIPSQFISSGKDVFAFLYHVGADYGRTVYKFRIPNKLRPDRTEETPTPEEQSVIDQAINALNEAVAQTAQDVIDADASAQASAESARASANSAVQASLSESNAERAKGNAQASAESASASATASAQSASQSAQIKADVEDLVDDAQGYAQASAQSATASANSASQAQGFAQSASASAQSASGYASDAQTSANTASAKAQDASQSASTASQKATESAQSASQALTYKTDAESAKTDSQTAQGLAESARDSAITAKDDAESARDEAQQAVASIADALDDKAPAITDTASGSIASFSDGADDLPLKSLVVDIDPVQDLHGQESPYPAGGGVNKWNFAHPVSSINASVTENADGTFSVVGSSSSAKLFYLVSVKPNQIHSIRLAKSNESGNTSVFGYGTIYDGNDDTAAVLINSLNFVSGKTFTPTGDYVYIAFLVTGGTGSGSATASGPIINEGSTTATFAPYSNICPISGWTSVDVEQRGKNLFDQSSFEWGNSSLIKYVTMPIQNGTYTLSTDMPDRDGSTRDVFVFAGQVESGASSANNGVSVTSPRTITVTDGYYTIANRNGVTVGNYNWQLELGSTATPYSPYTGRSITINLGQTVYGGKLDVLSGELVIDRVMQIVSECSSVDTASTGTLYANIATSINAKAEAISNNNISSAYKFRTNAPTDGGWFRATTTTIFIFDNRFTDKATADAILATEQPMFVYELAAPITIQLTPNQINSLYGVNNIWADSGDTEVEYRADTKLFIERLTAPDSADMVADANITSGQYFMVGNSLYKATANIANGAQIVVGTNCIRKSLSEALNEINA